MNGYIVKGIGGFYYVKTPDGIVECKPRGIFRKQKITPVAGDEVTLERCGSHCTDRPPQKRFCAPAGGKSGCAVPCGQHYPAHPQHLGAG